MWGDEQKSLQSGTHVNIPVSWNIQTSQFGDFCHVFLDKSSESLAYKYAD